MTEERRPLPHLHVACALIERGGRVLAAQRSAVMSLPLKWEFPGGKIGAGESPDACLVRELREELGVEARIGEALPVVTHAYPAFTVTLHPFRCTIESGSLARHEHAALAWLEPEELPALDWAAADLPVIEAYRALVAGRER